MTSAGNTTRSNCLRSYKLIRAALVSSCLGLMSANGQTVLFSDDFNRADSASLGNGWTTVSSNSQNVQIVGNEASFPYSNASAAFLRPFTFSQSIQIDATFFEVNGAGGLTRRHVGSLAVNATGTPTGSFPNSVYDGYQLIFYRGDSTYNNSTIYLRDSGTAVAQVTPSFQFGSSVTVSAIFNLDGSITGSVSSGASSESFSFGVHAISASGSNFSIMTEGTPGATLRPRFDNISISAVPEPSAHALFAGGMASVLAFCLRRRNGRDV